MITKSIVPKESDECIRFINYCRLNARLWKNIAHIGNERKCSPQAGALLKKMGVRKGHFDYFLSIPSGKFHGLYLEMKRTHLKNRKMPPEQIEFQNDKREQGYCAEFVFGWEDAMNLVKNYLDNKL